MEIRIKIPEVVVCLDCRDDIDSLDFMHILECLAIVAGFMKPGDKLMIKRAN